MPCLCMAVDSVRHYDARVCLMAAWHEVQSQLQSVQTVCLHASITHIGTTAQHIGGLSAGSWQDAGTVHAVS